MDTETRTALAATDAAPVPAVTDEDVTALVEQCRQASRETIRRCAHTYRSTLQWAGIHTEDDMVALYERAVQHLDSGEFWLTSIGRAAQTDVDMVMALLVIRDRWIVEFALASTGEKLLMDQALLALYHQLRLHQNIGNVEARAEHAFFGDEPLRAVTSTRDGVPQFEVDEHLRRINERMIPALEVCHRMLCRSVRLLHTLRRAGQVTIHNQGQVNLAHQQVNLAPTNTTE